MLILTRRLRESVMIGDDIAVTVLRITGNKVEIGIHAPKSTPVHRQEVYERLRRIEKRSERDARVRA